MTNILRIKMSSFILVSILTSEHLFAELQPVDQIAAIVNQDIVLVSELKSRTNEIKTRYISNSSVLPADDILQNQVLEQLILESIQLQLAKDAGLIAPVEEINKALQGYAANSGIELSTFIESQPDIYREVRKQIESQILTSLIQRREVSRLIQVNQSEIDAYLDTKSGREAQAKAYQFQYLRLKSSEEADRLYKDLVNGKRLSEQEGSQNLGFRKQDKLPSIITIEQLNQLNIGDTLAPIKANDSFHVFQLTDIQTANVRQIRQVKVRHILIKPNVLLPATEAKLLASNLLSQILEGADFATLAQEYSEDISSRVQGGNLDWQDPDTFVPEFTAALTNLKIDQVSDLVKTDFGWHIIQLLGERIQDISDQALRSQATQSIYQNRYQQELPRWINEQRERAFIEIRF